MRDAAAHARHAGVFHEDGLPCTAAHLAACSNRSLQSPSGLNAPVLRPFRRISAGPEKWRIVSVSGVRNRPPSVLIPSRAIEFGSNFGSKRSRQVLAYTMLARARASYVTEVLQVAQAEWRERSSGAVSKGAWRCPPGRSLVVLVWITGGDAGHGRLGPKSLTF